jgi:hypothetical protein
LLICCQSRQSISVTIRPAVFDTDIPAFDKTSVNKALAECAYKACGISRRCNPQKTHYRSLRLLRRSRRSARNGCSATERNEIPPPHDRPPGAASCASNGALIVLNQLRLLDR